jgi:Papain family cysteine protease
MKSYARATWMACLLTFSVAGFGQQIKATGLQFLSENAYQSIPLAVTPMLGQIPPRVDRSSDFPTPGDQGPQGSCVGWAVTYLKSYQERVERKWTSWGNERTFSPAFVYNQLKTTPDCSGGTFISEALNLLRGQGAATISSFPYIPNSCSSTPDAAIKQSARPYAIADWRRVNAQDEIEIKNHIASGFPVVIGAAVDDAFMQLGQQVYRMPGGQVRGGHAMVVVGYDDSQAAFKLINSWGNSWGAAGYGWISYGMFKSITREAYVAQDIVTSPSPVVITPPPERQTIYVAAANLSRGTNVAVGQCGPYGTDVLLNGAPCNARPNVAEYDITAAAGGAYRLVAEYAAAQPRPVRIRINGTLALPTAMSDATGCWTENCQRSMPQGIVSLAPGPNTIRVERDDVFPHIRSITLVPAQ